MKRFTIIRHGILLLTIITGCHINTSQIASKNEDATVISERTNSQDMERRETFAIAEGKMSNQPKKRARSALKIFEGEDLSYSCYMKEVSSVEDVALYVRPYLLQLPTTDEPIVLRIDGCPAESLLKKTLDASTMNSIRGVDVSWDKNNCVGKILGHLDLSKICVDVPLVNNSAKMVELLKQLPSQIVALSIEGWQNNTSLEEVKKIEDELTRFGGLQYLNIEHSTPDGWGFLRKLKKLKGLEIAIDDFKEDALLKTVNLAGMDALNYLKIRWWGEGNITNRISVLKTLEELYIAHFRKELDLEPLRNLDRLKVIDIWTSDPVKLLPEDSWPNLTEFMALNNKLRKKNERDFRRQHKDALIILNERDIEKDLFGKARKIFIRSAKRRKIKEVILKDKERIDEFVNSIEIESINRVLNIQCRGDLEIEVTTSRNSKETFLFGSCARILKWSGFSGYDLSLTENSIDRICVWLKENVKEINIEECQ